jgi:hypothetical protein
MLYYNNSYVFNINIKNQIRKLYASLKILMLYFKQVQVNSAYFLMVTLNDLPIHRNVNINNK